MSSRTYTIYELQCEQPKGNVRVQDDNGKVWDAFCCHGCQSCLYFVDVRHSDKLGQHYPHYLKLEEVK